MCFGSHRRGTITCTTKILCIFLCILCIVAIILMNGKFVCSTFVKNPQEAAKSKAFDNEGKCQLECDDIQTNFVRGCESLTQWTAGLGSNFVLAIALYTVAYWFELDDYEPGTNVMIGAGVMTLISIGSAIFNFILYTKIKGVSSFKWIMITILVFVSFLIMFVFNMAKIQRHDRERRDRQGMLNHLGYNIATDNDYGREPAWGWLDKLTRKREKRDDILTENPVTNFYVPKFQEKYASDKHTHLTRADYAQAYHKHTDLGLSRH